MWLEQHHFSSWSTNDTTFIVDQYIYIYILCFSQHFYLSYQSKAFFLSLSLMTNQERVQIREKNSLELELPPLTFSRQIALISQTSMDFKLRYGSSNQRMPDDDLKIKSNTSSQVTNASREDNGKDSFFIGMLHWNLWKKIVIFFF